MSGSLSLSEAEMSYSFEFSAVVDILPVSSDSGLQLYLGVIRAESLFQNQQFKMMCLRERRMKMLAATHKREVL